MPPAVRLRAAVAPVEVLPAVRPPRPPAVLLEAGLLEAVLLEVGLPAEEGSRTWLPAGSPVREVRPSRRRAPRRRLPRAARPVAPRAVPRAAA